MTSTTNPELDAIVDTSIEAVKAGMRILRQYQGIRHMPAARVKADNSLVSDLDTRTEAAITKVMNQGHPGLPLLREESGVYGDAGSSRYVVLVDPLDGTRPMTVGAPTSTVILAVYDRQQRVLVATVIGSPAHGAVWVAYDGVTTVYWNDLGRDQRRTCQVWEGDLRPSTTVLIDNLSGFSRAGRYGLTNADLTKLVGNLNGQVALQAYGSNGLHQALLAEGNPQLVGVISGAIGGPWDAAGVLLVLNAGGFARAFAVRPDGKLEPRRPLDPFEYDLLVMASTKPVLDQLVQALGGSY